MGRGSEHEDVLRTVQHPARRIVVTGAAHHVPLGHEDVAHDHGAQVQRPQQVDGDGDLVALGRQALVGVSAGRVREVHPDPEEVRDLARLPDQEVPPARPGQRGEGDQPQHVLRRVDLVGEDEGRDDQEGELREARAARGGERERGDTHADEQHQTIAHVFAVVGG